MEKHRLLHTPQTAYEVKFRICAAGPHISARKTSGMWFLQQVSSCGWGWWSGLIDSLPLLAAEQVLNVPMGKVLKHSGLSWCFGVTLLPGRSFFLLDLQLHLLPFMSNKALSKSSPAQRVHMAAATQRLSLGLENS